MIYSNLILNNEIRDKINSFYLNNRLPNAFIFHGIEGIGKEAHAIEFFAFINCEKKLVNEACGICPSCKKTAILQHEFLNIITPLPKSKSANKNNNPIDCLTEKERNGLLEQFSKKSNNPYYKIKMDKANTILISSIKHIKKNINLSISNNNIMVHLIFEAEKLCFPNQEAANSLLKILEEPKKDNLFILITSDINKIIDTILSRCTQIYFPEIKQSLIKSKLQEEKNIKNENAEIISKISFGNIREAYSMADSFDKDIKIIQKLIMAIIENDIKSWNSMFNYNNKEKIQKTLNLLIIIFRDISFYFQDSKLCFSNFEDLYKKFINCYPIDNYRNSIKIINNANDYILRNGNLRLITLSLFFELIGLFKENQDTTFSLSEWIN